MNTFAIQIGSKNGIIWKGDDMRCKVVSVLFCGHCPYSVKYHSEELGTHFVCSVSYRIVDHAGHIPDWCTLEDKVWTTQNYASVAETVRPLATQGAMAMQSI